MFLFHNFIETLLWKCDELKKGKSVFNFPPIPNFLVHHYISFLTRD